MNQAHDRRRLEEWKKKGGSRCLLEPRHGPFKGPGGEYIIQRGLEVMDPFAANISQPLTDTPSRAYR